MISSALALAFLVLGGRLVLGAAFPSFELLHLSRRRGQLRRVASDLRELEELLLTGLLPPPERWQALRELAAPWGALSYESLSELRAAGAAVLPTLRRLKRLAEEHEAALLNARARASQAFGQAIACLALVPCFGGALYLLLPGVAERPWLWLGACGGGAALSLAGAAWLLALAERARWGGLRAGERGWLLAAQCGGERFLALVRGGMPADLAWTRALELIEAQAPELALAWGHSVWVEPPAAAGGPARAENARGALIRAGGSVRKAVQISVMEGRPCGERVEAALEMLRQELEARVERELTLLGSRALKPLFSLVAPSVLGLLAAGIFLSWQSAAGL